MNSDTAQFRRFLELIPDEVMPNVWFIPLVAGTKTPDIPKGASTKDEKYRLEPEQALDRIKNGANVGIYALPKGLLFLDADTDKGYIVLPEDIRAKIPPTFTIKTRNGGLQYYFINNGSFKNKIHTYNGAKAGEIRADWYYVVAPGSYVKPDDDAGQDAEGIYRIINDVPIIKLDKIPEGITIKEENNEALNDWLSRDNKLKQLYEGDITGYASRSEAELALYQKLIFYRFSDSEIEKILSQSKIGKWATENSSYKEHTRNKAYHYQTERINENRNSSEAVYEEADLEAINQRQIKENNRKLEINLPDDHFVSLYVKWQKGLSDAYADYHIADALWILSATTRGKVVLDLKQELVKPNLWIFNVGKSTTSRKSTAVNKTRKIYEVATDIDLPNDDYSIEGYLESLSNYPITNNVRDEAAGLLAKFHKKYNEGIFDLECQLYDGQNIKKTLASGGRKEPKTYSIKNPYVTKLYATTGDNFARYMQIEDFTCGYGFRWLYTYPKYKKDRKALALTEKEDVEAWSQILTKIKTLYHYFKKLPDNMQFKVTDEAMQYHDSVCIELERAAEEQNNDILNSVIGRSEVHILKIAMLLEIGKNQLSDTITLETMEEAAQMVTRYFIPSVMDL